MTRMELKQYRSICAEIQEIHQNGMKYLAEINAQRVASEQALKEQTQKDFERGYAELRRAHSIHNDCGIEQEARKGFEWSEVS